jgi:hypothetical protein
MNGPRALPVAALVLLGSSSAAAYTENATFSIRSDDPISFRGAINDLYLMIDKAGGRNRVYDGKRMNREDQGGVRVFTLTVPLAEGDHIYIYLANPGEFVNLADPNLNPDDVPDGNFFRDPHPRFPGRGGQYGTDNVYLVRDPNRPVFDAATQQPGFGALVTGSEVVFSVEVAAGADSKNVDGVSGTHPPRVEVQDGPPRGVQYQPGRAVDPPWTALTDVSFSYNAGTRRGVLTARWPNPTEGFHLVRFNVSNVDGLAAFPLEAGILVNRDNQPPVTHSGGQKFAAVGQEIVVNAGMTEDPDLVGFTGFARRVVSGPAGATVTWRDLDEERRGEPHLDAHGNWNGDLYPGQSPVPRFKTDRAGDYVLGITPTDVGGAQGPEALTKVHVVQTFNGAIKVRLEPYVDGGEFVVDASLSTGGNSLAVFPDPRNPQEVSAVVDGMVARFPKPTTPGFYLFHAQVGGNSYHRTVMLKVEPDGSAYTQDYGSPPPAWRGNRVLYVAYIREFYDSNGDGEGDFLGMIDKMAHVQALGVNAIWLLPATDGPTTHGYAATAQFDAETDYGTMEQFDLLVETAHAFGMEVLMDLVANHTSDQHVYFKQAAANLQTPFRDYYLWNPDGSHVYWADAVALPNINTNNPLQRRLIVDMVRYWMGRGVDGIRADVAGDTPPSVWDDVRYAAKGINPHGVVLAELMPAIAEYYDQRFDMAYDRGSLWGLLDVFARGDPPSKLDAPLDAAETFFSTAGTARVRESLRTRDLLWMRYMDNQDEDRFRREAGLELARQKAAAGVMLALPGVPLITWGDEYGLVEQRGRMPFGGITQEMTDLNAYYQRLVFVRLHNWGLRAPDDAPEGQPGNTYLRISSDGDEGGDRVFSFFRHAGNQRFVVLGCNTSASVLGIASRFWPPASAFADFPDGQVKLVNHLKATEVVTTTKAELLSQTGFVNRVPGYGVKYLQATRFGIPDADGDGVLDSYDRCLGVSNPDQRDSDGDDVGDACDQCPQSSPGVPVNTVGCVTAGCGDGRRSYLLDGLADDDAYVVAQASGHRLHASFNGQVLYLATEAASRGEDVIIVVAEEGASSRPAPRGKAGQVAHGGLHLWDKGDDDTVAWGGATGQALAYTHPVPGRLLLEGTLNVLEEYGRVPPRLRVAALRYASAPGGALQSQVPSGSGDSDVTAAEMHTVELVVSAHGSDCTSSGGSSSSAATVSSSSAGPASSSAGGVSSSNALPPSSAATSTAATSSTATSSASLASSTSGPPASSSSQPASSGPTGPDGDGDGVADNVDNCVGVANPDQADFDEDGLGDLCDRCPASRRGATVDAEGCQVGGGPTGDPGDGDDDGLPGPCHCAETPGSSWPLAWAALVALGVGTRHPRRRRTVTAQQDRATSRGP